MRRERKRNSFTDMMILIFVILVCFGLTIYGVIYLTGVIVRGDETLDNVTVKEAPIGTDPETGDVLVYTDNASPKLPQEGGAIINTQPVDNNYPNIIVQGEPPVKPVTPAPVEIVKPAPVAPVVTPTPTVKPGETKPVTAVASVAKGDYVVQIMAVKSETAARTEAVKFKSVCPDVFVVKADLGDKGVWYRIRCGVSKTKPDAEKMKNRLLASFNVNPTVVPNK